MRARRSSGKTTLLGAAAGVTVPEAASIRLGQVELTGLSERERGRLRETGEFLQTPADAEHWVQLLADEFMEWAKAEQPRTPCGGALNTERHGGPQRPMLAPEGRRSRGDLIEPQRRPRQKESFASSF
jgi:ABC-type uncharacterized transport system ATPase component